MSWTRRVSVCYRPVLASQQGDTPRKRGDPQDLPDYGANRGQADFSRGWRLGASRGTNVG